MSGSRIHSYKKQEHTQPRVKKEQAKGLACANLTGFYYSLMTLVSYD